MTDNKNNAIEDLKKDLLLFINVKFISPIKINGKAPSIREYEKITSIGRATIDKLLKSQGYDVPISTISKVCSYAKISLTEFFTMFEEYLKEKETDLEENK